MSQLDLRNNTIDDFNNISVDIRNSQLNNAISNKIQSKMAELKDLNDANNESSVSTEINSKEIFIRLYLVYYYILTKFIQLSQFMLTENNDRDSYLDYTLHKSNILIRKEIHSYETSRFNQIEENENKKIDSKNNSNENITDTIIDHSNKNDDSSKYCCILVPLADLVNHRI